MQKKPNAVQVRIFVKMIDAGSIQGAGPANDAVNFVTLLQQQICEIGTILTGDAGDQRFLHENFGNLGAREKRTFN
jgi:hypothetical protein